MLSGDISIRSAQVFIKPSKDVEAFAPVTLGGAVIKPTEAGQFQRAPVLECGPSEDGDEFAVTLDKIKAGQLGRAVVFGNAQVKVNIKDKSHKYAVVKKEDGGDGSYFESAESGQAQILWKGGDSVAWCIIAVGASAVSFTPDTDETDTEYDEESVRSKRNSTQWRPSEKTGNGESSPILQIYKFDDDDSNTEDGLLDLITIEKSDGESYVLAEESNARAYELLVRFDTEDGPAVGYMPITSIGDWTGREEKNGECAHTTAPDGSDGSGGYGFAPDRGIPGGTAGGGNAQDMTIHPNRVFPSKTGPCW